MTNELGPEARALLDAAREGLGPDAEAIRRMRAKIDASIAGGAAGAGTGGGAGAGTGALGVKLGVVAAVAAAAIVAIVVIGRGAGGEAPSAPRVELSAEGSRPAEAATRFPAREAAPEAAPEAPEAPAPEAAAAPEIEMAPGRVEATRPAPRAPAAPRVAPPQPEQAAAPQASPQAAAPQASPPPASAGAPPPAPQAPAAPRRADLAREVELVDQAMAALRRGAPSAALAAVRVHAAETAGAGQLAEDAAAIEIEALCRLHDATVAAKLAAFDAKWPESAQRSRLTTRCP